LQKELLRRKEGSRTIICSTCAYRALLTIKPVLGSYFDTDI
jgi:hypothetical protein